MSLRGRRAVAVPALALIVAFSLGSLAVAPPVSAAPLPPLMTWSDLLGRPKPTLKPERIRYGDDPSQVVDLWRPPTPGPHPVIVMIHGGCWTASVASFHIMDWAAADLAQRGVAVWNIEYRRLEQPGGGYPGTYRDVAQSLFTLQRQASALGLRFGDGLVVLGHSAGGHLALWSAGASKLAQTGPLKLPGLPKVRAVIDLAGLADLGRDTDTACGPEAVAQMAGSPPAYASTSPAHMLPLGAELFVIHGARDSTVPPQIGARFAAKARAAGDVVHVSTPPGGHAEEIAPGTPSWEATAALVLKLVGVRAK